jgi:hypothetical protein
MAVDAGRSDSAGIQLSDAGMAGLLGRGVPGAVGNPPLAAAGIAGRDTGLAGAGGAGLAGAAPAANSGDAPATLDCGEGGFLGIASNAGATPAARGSGSVTFNISAGNQVLRMQTTLEVPAKPKAAGTVFLWPGLQALQGDDFQPVGNGVLQPVLTWGASCAPGSPSSMIYSDWWISSQYVNLESSDAAHRGCQGGKMMRAAVGDFLDIDMSLSDTIWSQVVTDTRTGEMVDFDIDMLKQPQRWAIFEIELPTSAKPVSDVVFTNTVITLAKPEPKACQPSSHGTSDYFSAPIGSSDGLHCCIARIVLRAGGVAATTQDP